MADVAVEGGDLVVHLTPWQRVGALSGDVHIPRSSIRSVALVDNPWPHIRGLRVGTAVPRVIALGRFIGRGYCDFVAVHRRDPGLVLELDGRGYRRLVVSTPKAREVASQLT